MALLGDKWIMSKFHVVAERSARLHLIKNGRADTSRNICQKIDQTSELLNQGKMIEK